MLWWHQNTLSIQQIRLVSQHLHMVDIQGPAVLRLPSLEQLKLTTLHCTVKKEDAFQTPAATRINTTKDLMQMYPDQFDKIGSMPGAVRQSVNKNIHPHIDAPRKTPIALKDYIKQELDNMVKNKIIRKVTEPTNWVSSLAYSPKKDGSLRICLDQRHLNTVLRRPHHATPTIEEITHYFTGAKIFSKLDAKAGYWSIHLNMELQFLTTF